MTTYKDNNKSIRPSARAVILCDKKILVLKDLNHSNPNYVLPGGGIEFGESAHEALRRELREEIGMDLSIGRFLGCFEQSFEHYRLGKLHDLALLFLVTMTTEEKTRVVLQEPRYEVYWVNRDELSVINFVPLELPKLLFEWLELDMSDAFRSGFKKDE